MEWRCFFPETREICEALNVQDIFSLHVRNIPSEKRSDNYVVATRDVGVKFRGEKKLEMKVRSR